MRDPQPLTTPVRAAHQFDEQALADYLKTHLEGFRKPFSILQFEGGQSNPTYLVGCGSQSFVLRKKPPGQLLPSAHAVEREYRIMRALATSEVPVCSVSLLCEDSSIIGTPFFVMEHVAGRVFHDPTLPGVAPADRTVIYRQMIQILSALHKIEPAQVGLEDFGKPGNYYARQISRWSRQYQASRTKTIYEMDQLMEWLPENIPPGEQSRIVHGDYRLGNMVIHPTHSQILAVLDWELSTLGDPLADLAYTLMSYCLAGKRASSLVNNDPAKTGIPSMNEQLNLYCRYTGRDNISQWNFYMAFSLFRSTAIGQGVYKRGLDGNASSETALQLGRDIESTAHLGWQMAADG